MRQKNLIYLALLLIVPVIATAQSEKETFNLQEEPILLGRDPKEDAVDFKANIVKLNLMGLALKNVSVQYERVLTRKSSVALGVRFAPESGLPFRSKIKDAILEEGEADEALERTVDHSKLSNFAITPEYRVYLGKGYGKGFYVAPFYRFAIYTIKNVNVAYGDDVPQKDIDLAGKFKTHTGGLLFGAQWNLAKSVTLDWWILGPSYGVGKGTIDGVNSTSFTAEEKEDIRQELDDLDIPLTETTYEITDNAVKLKLDGPWAGVRAGLSIGFKF